MLDEPIEKLLIEQIDNLKERKAAAAAIERGKLYDEETTKFIEDNMPKLLAIRDAAWRLGISMFRRMPTPEEFGLIEAEMAKVKSTKS